MIRPPRNDDEVPIWRRWVQAILRGERPSEKVWSRSAKFGGDTNYTEFLSDGTLKFSGAATCFVDELGDVTKLKVQGTDIDENAAENTIGLMTTCNPADDYLYANVQFNHYRKNGAVVFPHIHWFQAAAAVPNFLLQYRWQKNLGTKTTAWTNYRMVSTAIAYSSGTINQICYGAGITPPSGDGISDILQIRLTRDKNNTTGAFTGADSLNATANITSFDIHLEVDQMGSASEYVK
jgi:hypothetical protein